LEFRNVNFCGGGKTGEPREKSSEQGRDRTTNSTNLWHWWEASAITTVPPLFPLVQVRVKCLAQEEHNMMSPARALFKTALTESSALSIKPAPSAPHSIEGGGGVDIMSVTIYY